jgi:DNA repair exonuclease SbcCD ATPase subunit
MRILKLEINNIGGIRYHRELEPNGDNFLIYGPNGSGKSSIVNAIDFLLTGKISRMVGTGTQGIDYKKHGHHIDAKPEESYVQALIKLPKIEEPIQIKRSFQNPDELIVDDVYRDALKSVIDLASRSQHILTKREILKFVNATTKTRGDKIQELLKLKKVEEIHTSLKKIHNDLKKEFESFEKNLENCKGTVSVTINEEDPNSDNILKFVNDQRSILDGNPLDELDSSLLKEEVSPSMSSDENVVNIDLLNQDIEKIREIISRMDLKNKDDELRKIISEIALNELLAESVARLKLTREGLDLLDDSGKCPLCNTSWPHSKLKKYLEDQLKVYEEGSKDLDRMDTISKEIIRIINALNSFIDNILKAVDKLGIEDDFSEFKEWKGNLQVLKETLEDLDRYPDPRFTPEKIEKLCAPEDLNNLLEKLSSIAKENSPETTPEQTSWDLLTRLEVNLKSMENAEKDLKAANYVYNRAKVLYETFSEEREKVLDQLFEETKDRFVELYRMIHHVDESDFDASLTTHGSGVAFNVNFYGKGMNPPHALHSEGHQDSMGICLYLALSEQITQGYINLTVLDDVMTAVDTDHRREISRVLANEFNDHQIFITTHDHIWAEQLQKNGVVKRKNMYKLSNWTLDAGPRFKQPDDVWKHIRDYTDSGEIPAAAAELRRTSEEYFSSVCEFLKVATTHKESGGYDLGELLFPAIAGYKQLLIAAKKSADSWGRTAELKELSDISKKSSEIIKESQVEQWAINANVHYNNWANFAPNDFKPVVEAFEKLFDIFKCPECGSMLHLTMNGYSAEAVRCDCGSINWNLKEKPRIDT